MKISVVIPAFNASKTLDAAIASCLRQSYPPHEIIVVDDASTDNTINIAQKYPQVKLICLGTNSGPSTARNTGWAAASGEIIAFLDSDDTWYKEKLAVIDEVFSNNSNIQLLGHSYSVQGISRHVHPTTEAERRNYLSILLKNPYQPSCMAFLSGLPLRFNETYRYCEDHELSARVANEYQCYYLDRPLTMLGRPQLSVGGASGNVWKMRKGELKLYTSIYKHNILYAPFIPVLWLFSLCKMLIRQLIK